MVYTKNCILANKTISISTETRVAFRVASEHDIKQYIDNNWPILSVPKFDTTFWASFCRLLGNCYNDELFERIITAFSSSKDLSVPKDKMFRSMDFAIQNNAWVDEHERLIHGYSVVMVFRSFLTMQEVILHSSIDFATLLDTVSDYITYKHAIHDDVNPFRTANRLDTFFDKHRSYVNSYLDYLCSYSKRINDKKYQKFACANLNKVRILILDDTVYFEGLCGFDVAQKYKEIDSIIKKLKNTQNDGENKVEYALKWCVANLQKTIVPIKADCESKYRYECILLSKPTFIDEAQEYDHIVVTAGGIILIETKNWNGKVLIRPDGKWMREMDNGYMMGIDSPAFQIRRHEMLIQNIVPGVPVFSILCISGSKSVVDGREFFTSYPIISVDQLERTIVEVSANGRYSDMEIQNIVRLIDAHKINQK